jgi:hypothetical protein
MLAMYDAVETRQPSAAGGSISSVGMPRISRRSSQRESPRAQVERRRQAIVPAADDDGVVLLRLMRPAPANR